MILFANPMSDATLGVLLGFGVSPIIGASCLIGLPDTATSIRDGVGPPTAMALAFFCSG